MTEADIVKFLHMNRSKITDRKSEKAIREWVANEFGGIRVGRYVKIGEDEFLIQRNPDNIDCGFDIRKMDWDHGNNWKFFSPY